MLRRCNRLLSALVLALAVPSLTAAATAQVLPYSANGVAQFAANQSDFTGSGHATHLGRYTETGQVVFTPTANPLVFAVSGSAHYVAANRDELHAAITGTVDMSTGAIVATATYVGGTGRFANASGASLLTGTMLGGGALTIRAAGTLVL
jgi:hypothetical protein